MPRLMPYLSFHGRCREAMTFYKEALGGELNIMEVKDSPAAQGMPKEMHNQVMHSSLVAGEVTINAADLMRDPPVEGNTIHLMLDCSSEAEIRNLFGKLSAGGKVIDPLADMFWGAIFGTFEDKFGKRWMLNYNKPQPK